MTGTEWGRGDDRRGLAKQRDSIPFAHQRLVHPCNRAFIGLDKENAVPYTLSKEPMSLLRGGL
jgi:hypothetical protein